MLPSLFASDPTFAPLPLHEGAAAAAARAVRLGQGEGYGSRGKQPSLFDPTFERPHRFPLRNVRVEFNPNFSVLSASKGQRSDSAFDYALNPYRGCQIVGHQGYTAVFIAEDELGGSGNDWMMTMMMMRKRAIHQIAQHPNLGGKRILMSGVIDPYQPIEAKLELTRGILDELLRHDPKPRLVIQTRSPLVLRDIDLLRRFDHVRVNISITTDSEEVRKRYEPGCPSIARRLATVRELHEAGIPTAICLSPLLPVSNPARFAEQIRATGADIVVATPFRNPDRTGDTQNPATSQKLAYGEREFRRTMKILSERLASFRPSREAFCPV